MRSASHALTRALIAYEPNDKEAANRLWRLTYGELRQIAHRELLGERRGHTLSTTGLVHEAYLRLVDYERIPWQNRAHFYALACRAMRKILIDYARRRRAQKRGGSRRRVALDEAIVMAETRGEDLIALDEALTRLSAFDERLGQMVECRFFGGLSVEQTAEVLGVSERTAYRDWNRAKAYLYRALHMEGAP